MCEERFQLKVLVVSLAIMVASLVVSSSGSAVDEKTADVTINANVNPTIAISSSGNVGISVTPAAAEARLSSAKDTVTVSTNHTAGYNLTLEMFDAETSLVNGADTITQGSGSLASPDALVANTWGYRVADAGGFGPGAAVENSVAVSAYTWAGVPAKGAADQIKSTSGQADNDATDIWYAIMANSNKLSGTYSGKVTYTAATN